MRCLLRPLALLLLALAGVAATQPARNISFLGASATGRSVVIVIGQTETNRSWRELCLQTATTLRSLGSDQSFNIILMREQDCLALSPSALLPATARNIDNAIDTMHRWNSGGQGHPIPALELAFRLNPDIIYLLASRDFAGLGNDEVARFCADHNRTGGTRIHTLAIIEAKRREIPQGTPLIQSLQTIARDSDGQFNVVTSANLQAETPPDHTLAIRKRIWSSVVGFAPDNKTAYVSATVNQVNVWETIVYYWPEATAIVLGLIFLRFLIRVARKRHEPGEEYCRRCDYNLRGLPSPQCPECGTQLTPENRIPGRRRWPRVIVVCGLLVFVVAGYGFAAMRLPRQGSVSQWIEWRSIPLAKWATDGKHQWLLRHTTLDDAIVRVDLDSGKITGAHCRIEHPSEERLYSRMLSPDGRTLLCGFGEQTALVDCASGKIVRRFDFQCYQATYTRIGTQYLFHCHRKELAAWDIRTGKRINTAAIDGDSQIGGVFSSAGRDLSVILSEDDSNTIVRVWDPLAGTFVQTFRVQSRSCCCDGGRLYAALNSDTNLTIETWDLLTGQRQGSTPTGQTLPIRYLGMTARKDWVAITSSDNETLAINLRTGAHRSWQMRWPLPTISPDGRHLIAGAYCGAGHFDEVRIHDLPEAQ